MLYLRIALFAILLLAHQAASFSAPIASTRSTITRSAGSSTPLRLSDPTEQDLRSEAELLLNRAKEIRATLPVEEKKVSSTATIASAVAPVQQTDSKWSVQQNSEEGVGYRLELDIGREDGTWMDPRWGASGKRIEMTLDVVYADVAATREQVERMVKDNFGGKSSSVSSLVTAPEARLRNGFDQMKCEGGAYRVDSGKNGQTCRFYINVEGTPERGSSYGDIFVPKGCLYFSLPCFGGVSQLSTKEGIATVREMGWHTGWRREESRIVGVVFATPIEKARRRDGF